MKQVIRIISYLNRPVYFICNFDVKNIEASNLSDIFTEMYKNK